MIRTLTASLFLLAFVVQMFSGQFIKLDYLLNSSAYAKNCENKATPKLHCNGKCQMMKKMQEEEKKNQQVPERKAENKDEVLSSKSFFCSVNISSIIVQQKFPLTAPPLTVDRTIAVFHPPQV